MKEFIEKLIARLEEEYKDDICDLIPNCDEFNNCKDCRKEFIKKIIEPVLKEYNGGWIPCSERLPEKNGEYIVMIKGATRPTFLNYYAGAWFGWDEDGIEYYEVVAWQPLPDPYKEV